MPGSGVDPAVEAYVASATPPVRAVLTELLELVRETLPDARETIKWGRPVFSAGSDVCYLAKARAHGSLGFYRGAELDDPGGVLQGGGKKLRHVKVEIGAEIPRETLRALLESAWELARE